MIVAILAVLKAGGAYVPLDPAYPEDRLRFMVEDARIQVLLSEDEVLGELPVTAPIVLAIDGSWPIIEAESAEPLPPLAAPANAAYVIYTSGSTGRPKGVVVAHAGLGNVAEVHRRTLGVGPGSRVLQLSSLNFDASVWEMVMALLNGATLVLASQEALRPGPDLLRTLAENAVTSMTVPPSVLAALPHAELPALSTLVVAGEACSEDLVGRWAPGRRFWDAYGPTETTICASMGECSAGGGKPSIGRPIAGMRVHVLDARLEPAPIGVPGEICVGGAGIARGYLGRPDVTAERFVPDPFAAGDGARLYRTGDLARWRPDGSLDFLGRTDHQVKLRGFRIELGEIDAVLRQHPGVADAVTIVRDDRLVAYFVPADPATEAADLRAHLRDRLPDHMVPSAFVPVAAMPLTPNGKVDRRALPAPEGRGAPGEVAPRSPVEEVIAGVWADVLGLEHVGIRESFFELGGHSLLATQVMARIAAALSIELPLQSIFDAPTVEGLAQLADTAIRAGQGMVAPPLVPVPRDAAALPLSFGQERLWFLAQLAPDDPSYVAPLALWLGGPLDHGALERALGAIVDRHEVLRTRYATVGGRPVGVVAAHEDVHLPVTSLASLPPAEREAAVQRALAGELSRPFDLAREAPLRARLFVVEPEAHVLAVVLHHIATDGWSNAILKREIGILYEAFARGAPSPLPDLPVQYADYAAWQRGWLDGDVLDRQLDYWRARLAGAPRSLDLPSDRPRPRIASHRGAHLPFALGTELAGAVRGLSRRAGATPFMTLLAAFDALLYRYTGQADLVVGFPIAGRTRAETEALMGFFVNTLVLRTELAGDMPFEALVQRVKEVSLGAYAHQDVPFERLVQDLQPERDLGRSPLFQVLFSMQDDAAPGSAPGSAPAGLRQREVGSAGATSKFDLTWHVVDGPRGLTGVVEYATDLFDRATIERMVGHFRALLEGAVADPGARLDHLPLLGEAERRTLLVTWNDTAFPHPEDALIHEIVAREASRSPDAVAISFEGHDLTFGELDARSNRLAHLLRARGVGPETLVGVCMDRSIDLLVALHGVLKAGGAYLPLDPEYPADRLAFMLDDARPPILLTQEHLARVLPERPGTQVVHLDADAPLLAAEPATALARGDLSLESLAYVIYTSGSTGRPKGAMNEHRGILNRLQWMQRAYGLTEADRVLQKTPFSFDVSVWELFWPLLVGARLVVARPHGHRDPAYLAEILAAQGVTTLHFVPSMLKVFLDEIAPRPAVARALSAALRRVMCSGEALPPALAARLLAVLPGVALHNLYGPTEAAVDVTACAVLPGAPVTLGRPIHNTRINLIDAHLQPFPVGVRGEHNIGGVQVGRAYLNRPELTAERFVRDPFAGSPSARMYRTGDVARWLPSGEIEYLGRADFQVKLRGFRIELGEIEAALTAHPAVGDAAVLAREDLPVEMGLVAYVVPAGAKPTEPAELRASLAARLPEHMVPSAFVVLAALPLTSNGKVDRRALPAPEPAADAESAFTAPRTPTEEAIAAIWREVLGVPRVGVDADFFALGGHSLLATQVMTRIAEALRVELPLATLFELRTVAKLAEIADAVLRAHAPAPVLDGAGFEEGEL